MMYSDSQIVSKIEEFLDSVDLLEFLEDNDLSPAETLFLLWQDGRIEFPVWSELSEIFSSKEEDIE